MAERAQFAETLLESLQYEPVAEVERGWIQELKLRAHQALHDESVLEEWDDVRAQLRRCVRDLQR